MIPSRLWTPMQRNVTCNQFKKAQYYFATLNRAYQLSVKYELLYYKNKKVLPQVMDTNGFHPVLVLL